MITGLSACQREGQNTERATGRVMDSSTGQGGRAVHRAGYKGHYLYLLGELQDTEQAIGRVADIPTGQGTGQGTQQVTGRVADISTGQGERGRLQDRL